MQINEKEIEDTRRAKLRREKPAVYEKVINIAERHQQGIATPIIDIAYNYICNLKCRHCTASRFVKKERKLTPSDLKRLSDEAHELGLCQFCISGGEPLIFKDLDEIIAALQPDKFHLTMSTNGHFMTPEMALHLKSIGLDKVKISLDDFHNENDRSKKEEAHQKAKQAMLNAKTAGLSVVVQTVITHQNCQSHQTVEYAKFAQENDFAFDVLIARATGAWEGNHAVLVTEEDADFLWKLHEQYPVLHRDTFPSYGMNKGCNSVKASLHLTQYGDILPCAWIHISIGNIFKENLSDIIKRGMSIKHFRNYNSKCLSGEDRNFIQNYMTKFYGKPIPIHWSKAFGDDDFCN